MTRTTIVRKRGKRGRKQGGSTKLKLLSTSVNRQAGFLKNSELLTQSEQIVQRGLFRYNTEQQYDRTKARVVSISRRGEANHNSHKTKAAQ